MRGLITRVSVEGLLVGLGVVVGKTVGWVLIVFFGAVLAVEVVRWLRERRTPTSSSSPVERRKQFNNSLYPPRDDRLELGERCATFAMKMRVFNEEQEWRRERAIGNVAAGLRLADPGLDPGEARKEAEARVGRIAAKRYGLELRDEALKLFDEAYEQRAIAEKVRRIAKEPLAVELEELPLVYEELACRLGYETPKDRSFAYGPASGDLANRLDSLMREGAELVAALNVPVTPERTNGGWKLEAGTPPDDWWEKASDFTEGVRNLLLERHPALLTDYRDGYNAHVREERKKQKERNAAEDERSTPEKMLDFANFERSGPRRVVEASLEGLAAARHRLAASPPAAASSS